MIYHVLPGDALVAEFKKTGIGGTIIVCREALIAGPLDGDTLEEFWDQRARFVLAEYGQDEIEYHERVADELSKLIDRGVDDEVNLWFEYELFCSVNMWLCLSLLNDSKACIYRVEPIGLDENTRWDGFATFTADDLHASFELRTKFDSREIAIGAQLWDAYRRRNYGVLRDLAHDGLECFPHLNEVVAAAAEQDVLPGEVVREIVAGGETDFSKVFSEFKKRAGVYGYGDLQVEKLMQKI